MASASRRGGAGTGAGAAVLLATALLVGGAAAVRAEDDPDTEVARRLFQQGSALYVRGEYEKALKAFEEARLARPSPAFDFNIARCHDRLGRWDAALAEYERVVTKSGVSPDVREAQQRIAVLRDRVKVADRRQESEDHYRKAIGHFNGGDYARAVNDFQLAHQAVPDPIYLYNAAQAYRLGGDLASALRTYQAFMAAAPDSPIRGLVEKRIVEARRAQGGARTVSGPAGARTGTGTVAGADAPVASERLKPVQELIKKNRPGFRECFDAWSARNPGVAGKVTLSFYLDPDGVLNQASAESSGFSAPDVTACIVRFARTLRYPVAPNGKYTRFAYPFDFKPNG